MSGRLEKYDDFIRDKDDLIGYIKNHPDKVVVMNGDQIKEVFDL